jgi:hypothetical protein
MELERQKEQKGPGRKMGRENAETKERGYRVLERGGTEERRRGVGEGEEAEERAEQSKRKPAPFSFAQALKRVSPILRLLLQH